MILNIFKISFLNLNNFKTQIIKTSKRCGLKMYIDQNIPESRVNQYVYFWILLKYIFTLDILLVIHN